MFKLTIKLPSVVDVTDSVVLSRLLPLNGFYPCASVFIFSCLYTIVFFTSSGITNRVIKCHLMKPMIKF